MLEPDATVAHGEDGVVPAEARAIPETKVMPRWRDDRAGGHQLAIAGLDAEALALAVATVLGARTGLLVCHR
jgi:hypothetical protein